MNLYGFAGGDPVNFSDPFGLCPIPKPGENCVQEGINWVYGKTHSEGLLNALAGVDAILTGIGETTSLEGGGIGGPASAATGSSARAKPLPI